MSAKKLQNRLFGGKKEDRLDTGVGNSNSNRSGDASPSDDAPTPTATNPNPESIPSSQSNSDRLKINIPPPITSQLQAEQRESLQGREKERSVYVPFLLLFPKVSFGLE
jgi:hypothetical protein